MTKQGVFHTIRRNSRSGVPLGRAGEPDEITRLAVFLAGPGGAYITGTAIPVAGGDPVGL